MRVLTAMLLMAAATPVVAQDITEEQKVNALMLAYRANGNSMVGWGSYDATKKQVKTEKIVPVPFAPANEKNPLDAIADMTDPKPAPDICKTHKMHRVTTGNSWRCRK